MVLQVGAHGEGGSRNGAWDETEGEGKGKARSNAEIPRLVLLEIYARRRRVKLGDVGGGG